jgi:hypothetical protein
MLANVPFTIFLSSHLHSKHFKIKIYKTVILPVVLYVYETWSFTLREEHRLGMFENWVLRRIFGPEEEEEEEEEEVVGGYRRWHNKEPHNLYASPIG